MPTFYPRVLSTLLAMVRGLDSAVASPYVPVGLLALPFCEC
jgi:hypothetical protein